MYLRSNRIIKVAFWVMAVSATITGCGGKLFTYNGYVVFQNNLIVQLEDGNQQGEWKTNELSIDYQYQMSPGNLEIDGTIELADGFSVGYDYISNFAVYLLFLDNRGIVVNNVLIYAGNSGLDIPMTFERTLPLPDGVRSISFAYNGDLSDSGEEGGYSYSIWLSPSRQ